MTNHTEARLSREAEIAYVSLSMSTDYDCWHEDHDDVSVDMIIQNLNSNTNLAKQIVSHFAKSIAENRPASFAHDALKDAIEKALEGDDVSKIAEELADSIDDYIRGMEITFKVTGKAAKDVKVEQQEIE